MSFVRVIAGIVVALLVVAACASAPDDEETEATSLTTASSGVATTLATTLASGATGTMSLDPSGCPVGDAAFCATAVEVVDALAAGDVDRLLELSRFDRVECADVVVEYFPGCATDDVVEGHGLSGPDLLVDLVDRDRYTDWLVAMTTGVDVSFADQLGDGAVQVVGIGTCGPNEPGRRTYHVAWTAALRDGATPAERMLGSFELTFVDDWRIALSYVGSLTDWEAAQSDPLEEAFCAAGRSPWQT
jgi:hypothetical protein